MMKNTNEFMTGKMTSFELRAQLVSIALEWERRYGVSPAITSAISEFDVALLVGLTPEYFGVQNNGRTAVQKGFDFMHDGLRYQVKANRPSGKPGSKVTIVSKANNYEWDLLVWVLYDREYNLLEAWQWNVQDYRSAFDSKKRIGPSDMRNGLRVSPK